MRPNLKLTEQFYFPGGAVLLAAVGAHLWTPARAAIEPFLMVVCILTFAVGVVLGCIYNRSRSLAALVVLAVATWLLPALYSTHAPSDWRLPALVLLVPLNLIIFLVLPDQGLRAPGGLLSGTALATQAVALPFLPVGAAAWIATHISRGPLPAAWFGWTWIGQWAVLAFGAAAILLVTRFYWRRRPTDRGLFWALAAAFAAIHALHDRQLALMYFGAGALILTVSLAEHAHAMAYVDELSGLANRRALNEFLPQLHGRFSLGMVDVDHFKKFNDTYGHDAGDQVLRKVAAHLAAVSGGGRAFRYGGEEFTVVFPGLSQKEAQPFLEALRVRIEDAGFRLRGALRPKRKPKERRVRPRGGKKAHVTVSIGVAEYGGKLDSAQAVIDAADRALYSAKEAGRNQVQLA